MACQNSSCRRNPIVLEFFGLRNGVLKMKSLLISILGLCSLVAIGFPLNPSFAPDAVRKYKVKADAGDAEAQYLYSVALANGLGGVAKNDLQAFTYAKKAVDQGYHRALRLVGLAYDEGWGIAPNPVKAAKYFSMSLRWAKPMAEKGDPNAQITLGKMYACGNGVKKDETEASRWFRKAAEQGDADAQNFRGVMYARGIGVEKDETEAVNWYRKSASQNYAVAQYNLGYMYEYGKGIEKDETEAVKWYRMAAEQYLDAAQNNLGGT